MNDGDSYALTVEDHPERSDIQQLIEGLDEHARPFAGVNYGQELGVFLRDTAGNVVAGLSGGIWSGWLDVKFLWVKEISGALVGVAS